MKQNPFQRVDLNHEAHRFVSQSGPKPMSVHFGFRHSWPVLQLVVVVLCLAVSMFSQTPPEPSSLSLQQAASMALEKNPLGKAALADTKAASAGVSEAQSFLMPHLTFSELATRGDDPVYVFGSKLRQQRFTTNDFFLNQLNTPRPYGNFTTRFGGTWNLFDSFASWHGVSRARAMNTAAEHQLERTEQEILFRVVQPYYGVLLDPKQVEVAEQSEKPGGVQQGAGRGVERAYCQGPPDKPQSRTHSRQKQPGTRPRPIEFCDGCSCGCFIPTRRPACRTESSLSASAIMAWGSTCNACFPLRPAWFPASVCGRSAKPPKRWAEDSKWKVARMALNWWFP